MKAHLEIEIKVVDIRDALVDDGAGARIAVPRHTVGVCLPESRVVPLPADNDGQERLVRCARRYLRELERLTGEWSGQPRDGLGRQRMCLRELARW